MKKFITLCALAAATASFDLRAADGLVNLTNYDSNNPIFYFNGQNMPVAGSFVQVLGGPVGGALVVLASTAPGNPTVFPLTEPGFFDGGFGVVPGVTEGGQGSFQIRAWRNAPSFDAAVISERAQSVVFQNAVGFNPPPPGTPAPARLLVPPFGFIPEPSTFSLGLLAALGLVVRRVAFTARRARQNPT